MASLGYDFSLPAQPMELRSGQRLAVDDREQIAKRIIEAGLGLRELFIDRENLETHFLRQIGREVHHD